MVFSVNQSDSVLLLLYTIFYISAVTCTTIFYVSVIDGIQKETFLRVLLYIRCKKVYISKFITNVFFKPSLKIKDMRMLCSLSYSTFNRKSHQLGELIEAYQKLLRCVWRQAGVITRRLK